MISTIVRNARYVVRKRGMMPVYLLLGATYRCNARCISCFNWRSLNKPDVKELTIDEHRSVATAMGRIIWVLFTGGEPILREDLPELAGVYYSINGARRITVPTNALLPDRTLDAARGILDQCPKANVAFSLAIDGVGELHDSIRGVKGNFDALLETYDLLAELKRSERRFSINLNTVLMDRNIDHYEGLMKFVLDRIPGADFHGFEILRGSPPDESLKPPTAEQYKEALEKLVPYWSGFSFYRGPFRRIIKAAKIESRLMELEALRGEGPDMPCHAGWVSCLIDPVGGLYFCEELPDPIGNLRDVDYEFKKLWYSGRAEEKRRFIASRRCRCTHSCFLGSSMLFEPRYYGRLLKRIILPSHPQNYMRYWSAV